jgi:hypothetical protein
MYRGFMPHPPKLISVDSNITSDITMELRVNYPQVSTIDAEIFNNVLKVNVKCKDNLDDLKTQTILRAVKSSICASKLRQLKYENISVSIFNANTIYRFTTATPLNNDKSLMTTWVVSKTVIVNDKEINSESIFEEKVE